MRSTTARIGLAVLLTASVLGGCTSEDDAANGTTATSSAAYPAPAEDQIFQYSTLSALMAGVYEGDLAIGELAEEGDFGLGTLNTLDGEMVLVDGQTFQVRVDGSVHAVDDGTKTPFAVVTDFDADTTVQAPGEMGFEQLKTLIDGQRLSENIPFAVKVEGAFTYMKTRSVPAQSKPYRPLSEVLKSQAEFEFTDVEGVLVGFWLPDYMNGANAGGYHLHFLGDARDIGGHLLDCRSKDVTVSLDGADEWRTVLPAAGAFLTTKLSDQQYQ
jgi:acetolactate decarboxylase